MDILVRMPNPSRRDYVDLVGISNSRQLVQEARTERHCYTKVMVLQIILADELTTQ